MKSRLLLSMAQLLVLPLCASAAVWDWEVFMSAYTVRSLIRVGDDLYGASNCGLFRFHLPTETFESFTTADGLSYNDIRALALDERNNLILGMGNASVDVFNLGTRQINTISDFKLNSKVFQIYALHNYQGDIFVGTDIGVSRLSFNEDWNRYVIAGNYNHLGDFAPEIPVKCIQVFENGLWVGTQSGLARGDLSQFYLESPEAWSNFTTAQGLAGDTVAALAVFENTLYAASTPGLSTLTDSTFEALSIGLTSFITFLKAHQDTLYYGRGGGIYRLAESVGVLYGSYTALGLALEFAEDGTMWAGMQLEITRLGGLKKFVDGDWLYYDPESPQLDIITDVVVQEDGSLWISGSQAAGFGNGALAHFDGDHWINLTRQYDVDPETSISPDSFFSAPIRALALDTHGGLWAGGDARGAAWFRAQDDTVLANAYYSASSGRLFGIATGPNFCVVRDVMTDGEGNVWICNSEANPLLGLPIAVVPEDFIEDSVANPNWTYLVCPLDPPQNQRYQSDRVAMDSYGRKWFGANNQTGSGIRILDDNGTLSASDDEWYALEGLPSDSIAAIVCDREGVVWVGTPAGVQYFYPVENPEELLGTNIALPLVQSVRAIGVDPQNNKWFGTIAGVSVLASDNFTWIHNYTTFDGQYPSPLPGDVVQAISFDQGQGYAYLGTDKGLARLQTPYKSMGATVTSVSIWPNPFVLLPGGASRLYFDPAGLDENTEIKIFTVSGLLVRHLNLSQINSGWDGRNWNNEFVGTGVYLLLAYSSDGSTGVSKVAVIHP
jgi:ligand-binding sensor domain-containing protein